jgi:hypothetical protein
MGFGLRAEPRGDDSLVMADIANWHLFDNGGGLALVGVYRYETREAPER